MFGREKKIGKISICKKFKLVSSNKLLSNFTKDAILDFNAYISYKIQPQVEQTFFLNLITNFKAEVEKVSCIMLRTGKIQELFLSGKVNSEEDIQIKFNGPKLQSYKYHTDMD